jgi:histidinol-phosphatase
VSLDLDESDIALAHELAALATRTSLEFDQTQPDFWIKPDGSPVSTCDYAVEKTILDRLVQERPDDGVLSEESGTVSKGDRRWIIDPIDGTSSFISGGCDWGTHIALECDGSVVLAIVTRPLEQRRWWAASGYGAFCDADDAPQAQSRRLAVSRTTAISEAHIGIETEEPRWLAEKVVDLGATRSITGSPILDLIEGTVDAVIYYEYGVIWDHAPAVALTTMAGGDFCDPVGGPSIDLRGGIFSNGHLDLSSFLPLRQFGDTR